MRNYELENYLKHYGVPGMKRPRGLKYKTNGVNATLYQNRQSQIRGNGNSGGGGGRIPDEEGRTHNGSALDKLTQEREKRIKSNKGTSNKETSSNETPDKVGTSLVPNYTPRGHHIVGHKGIGKHDIEWEIYNHNKIKAAKTREQAKKNAAAREKIQSESRKAIEDKKRHTDPSSNSASNTAEKIFNGSSRRNSAKNYVNSMFTQSSVKKNSAKNEVNKMVNGSPSRNSARNTVNSMLNQSTNKNSAKNKVNEILYNPNSAKPLSKKQSTSVAKDTMNQTLEGLGIKKKKKKSGPKTSWRDE